MMVTTGIHFKPKGNSSSIKILGILEENWRCSGYKGNLMADEVTKGHSEPQRTHYNWAQDNSCALRDYRRKRHIWMINKATHNAVSHRWETERRASHPTLLKNLIDPMRHLAICVWETPNGESCPSAVYSVESKCDISKLSPLCRAKTI